MKLYSFQIKFIASDYQQNSVKDSNLKFQRFKFHQICLSMTPLFITALYCIHTSLNNFQFVFHHSEGNHRLYTWKHFHILNFSLSHFTMKKYYRKFALNGIWMLCFRYKFLLCRFEFEMFEYEFESISKSWKKNWVKSIFHSSYSQF